MQYLTHTVTLSRIYTESALNQIIYSLLIQRVFLSFPIRVRGVAGTAQDTKFNFFQQEVEVRLNPHSYSHSSNYEI